MTPTGVVSATSHAAARKTRRTQANAITEPAPTLAVLTNGPVVGAVTADSARVFARTGRAASLRVQYSTDPNLTAALVTIPVETNSQSDFTGQVTLTGLTANTVYYYNLLIDDRPQLKPPYPTFKTFVPPGQAQPFKFVILTDFGFKPTNVFRNAAREAPDFVIIGGDFSHTAAGTLARKRKMFRFRYSRHNALADFANLILDRFAVAHFWDDHDYGKNNSDKTSRDKALSLQVLQEYFPVYPVTRFGDWQKFSYGNAEFFLLDSRSQRDPNKTPDGKDKSMLDGDNLGAEGQYDWLVNGLRDSKAEWKFILTPVVFNPTVPKADSWTGFQYERNKLVEFIQAHNIEGVILLSGDLHAGGIDDGTHSGFPEMLVPSVNTNGCLTAPQPGKWSEGIYVVPRQELCGGYGLVSVETNPPRATLQVKDDTGNVKLELKIDR